GLNILFILLETQYCIVNTSLVQQSVIHRYFLFIEVFVQKSNIHRSWTGIIIQFLVDYCESATTKLRIYKIFNSIGEFFLVKKTICQIKTRNNHYHYRRGTP